jgi:hypothetical protein
MTTYKVHESIDNFSAVVFESDNFYEVQDYLQDRFNESDCEDEQLFYSYFCIKEA